MDIIQQAANLIANVPRGSGDWTDAVKDAVASVRKVAKSADLHIRTSYHTRYHGKDDAEKASAKAVSFSKLAFAASKGASGDAQGHKSAVGFHKDAAKYHDQASERYSEGSDQKQGHKDTAEAHRKTASAHDERWKRDEKGRFASK